MSANHITENTKKTSKMTHISITFIFQSTRLTLSTLCPCCTFRNGERRRPLRSEDIQADTAVTVNVWVVDSCCECNLAGNKNTETSEDVYNRTRVRLMLCNSNSRQEAELFNACVVISCWKNWFNLMRVVNNQSEFMTHKRWASHNKCFPDTFSEVSS